MKKSVTLGSAVLLAACAALPPEMPDSPGLSECRTHFLTLDEITKADGVRNGSAYRIPGFPYLRSNRFLASFRGGVNQEAAFQAWVEQLRRWGLESREPELRNLGQAGLQLEFDQLDRCGKAWAARDLADPLRRAQLLEQAAVPDDYSRLKRFFGLYTFAVPFLKSGINAYQSEVHADYARPVETFGDLRPMTLWQPVNAASLPAAQVAQWLMLASQNPLGIPDLSREQWWKLASAHAPEWWVETGGEFDKPGALRLKNGEATLDTGNPVTYFLPGYTRFGGKVLPQLIYVVWFSERPKRGWIDSYAGKLDGVVWRVTLDSDGQPLVYDTIHPCGCYHYIFPAKVLKRRPQDNFWQESVLFPQADVAAGRPAIRVQSVTHFVRRVATPEQASSQDTRKYQLKDYRELLSLHDGDKTRSLFCADGLVCGTERFERLWLFSTGIESPGAMRQWGRHATAFVGRRHFDEPDLLEKLFVAP